MRKLLLLIALLIAVVAMKPQGTDYDYNRIKIGEAKHIVSGLALSPDYELLCKSRCDSSLRCAYFTGQCNVPYRQGGVFARAGTCAWLPGGGEVGSIASILAWNAERSSLLTGS